MRGTAVTLVEDRSSFEAEKYAHSASQHYFAAMLTKRSGFDIWDTATFNSIIPLNIQRFSLREVSGMLGIFVQSVQPLKLKRMCTAQANTSS